MYKIIKTNGGRNQGRGENTEDKQAKVTVRGGLVLARGQTANPLEFGGERKTIGKL